MLITRKTISDSILKDDIMIRKTLHNLGEYTLLMGQVFRKPEKWAMFGKSLARELQNLGTNSIGIVVIISFFIGAVLAMQTSYNLVSPLIPKYLIGLLTRETMLLEFSSTIVSLILAGKIGSSISSEIGTMRITEQIDALDIMGVNAPNYLILPKVTAAILFFPFLCMLSMTIGIFGGWLASVTQHLLTSAEYVYGIRYVFNSYYIVYSIIKIEVFALIISTVSSYQGFFVTGGSLEVGKASTRAVVHSSVLILMFNLILTKILL